MSIPFRVYTTMLRHGTTTTGNVGFRCAKSVSKPVEYHYVDVTDTQHLGVEDSFDRKDAIPMNGWEDQFLRDWDEDEDEQPRKRKVLKRHERLTNEL